MGDVFPKIVRSRDYYVYDEKGNRYLDLYLGDSRYVLGHRVNNRLQLVKSVLSKGLFHNYPHLYMKRLEKSFISFWGSNIRVFGFRDIQLAQNFVKDRSKGKLEKAPELWQTEALELSLARWRVGVDITDSHIKTWQFYPPLPAFLGYICFFIERTLDETYFQIDSELWDAFTSRLIEQSFYSIRNQHSVNSTLDFSNYVPFWKREYQSLIPLYKEERHKDVYQNFLSQNILISPRYGQVLTLPLSLKKEDQKHLRKVFNSFNTIL